MVRGLLRKSSIMRNEGSAILRLGEPEAHLCRGWTLAYASPCLHSVCANADGPNIDHKIEASELLRRHEARKDRSPISVPTTKATLIKRSFLPSPALSASLARCHRCG